MEDHDLTEPTLALVRDLRAATPDVGVVIQAACVAVRPTSSG